MAEQRQAACKYGDWKMDQIDIDIDMLHSQYARMLIAVLKENFPSDDFVYDEFYGILTTKGD